MESRTFRLRRTFRQCQRPDPSPRTIASRGIPKMTEWLILRSTTAARLTAWTPCAVIPHPRQHDTQEVSAGVAAADSK